MGTHLIRHTDTLVCMAASEKGPSIPKILTSGWRWTIALLYLAALLTGTHLPEDHAALKAAIGLTGSDKVAHFLAYLGLALLVFAFCGLGRTRATALGFFAMLAVVGGADELTQPFFGRPAEWSDWIADVMGLALGLAAAGRWRR